MRKRSSVYACTCMLVMALVVGAPTAAHAATIEVPAGGNLQAALDAAQPGDTILLAPGATYVGNFKLPVHAGTTYVTIRSAASDALLPPAGTRMSPAYAPHLPKLKSANSLPAMRTLPGAAFWRLQFLELEANYKGQGDILALGDGSAAQNTLTQVPHHLIIDRVYLHGDRLLGQKRGIGLNSAHTAIVNSYVADIKAIGQDTQAIATWNGPGPFRIENNYLEASTEVVLFGGDDPKIADLVPSDIIIRNNTLSRPVSWRDPIVSAPTGVRASVSAGGTLPAGTYAYRVVAQRPAGTANAKSNASVEATVTVPAGSGVTVEWDAIPDATTYLVYGRAPGAPTAYWTVTSTSFVDSGSAGTAGTPKKGTVWQVKNIFELKNAQRVQIDHNLMENNWSQAQNGFAVLFTPRNQYGACTWCVVQNVVFEYNVVRNVGGAINLLGQDYLRPTRQTNDIIIRHNEFSNITKTWGNGYFLNITDQPGKVVFDHNTIISKDGAGILMATGAPIAGFEWTNNVARHNTYGIIGSGTATGNATLAAFFPGAVVSRNVFAGGNASKYPAGNEFPTVADFESHFIDYGGGDYRLNPETGWARSGTDGLDLGAAMDAIAAPVAVEGIDVPHVATTALPATVELDAYSATLEAAGGTAPYTWRLRAGALPAGLFLDPVTGQIAGSAAAAGDHSFMIELVDVSGATAAQPLAIHVDPYVPPNVAPVVSVTWSTTSSTTSAAPVGSSIALTAAALDVDGWVPRVDFYVNGEAVGSATSAPFAIEWLVATPGPHHVTAVAVDDDGASASAETVVATTSEIVLWASDVTQIVGDYQVVADASAAGGVRVWNPDRAGAKLAAASANPVSYVELTFHAEAGRPYHLWLRGKAERNAWKNDSAFVQFDHVANARVGTSSSALISLEDDVNAGVAGWGWQDNGYGATVTGAPIVFDVTGAQTIRIQPREDGLSFDQIVLSPADYLAAAPGAMKHDATILPR